MTLDDLAKRMKTRRLERNMTQTQLATALGISQEMVARLEDGSREFSNELLPTVRRWIATGAGMQKPGASARGAYRRSTARR